MTMSEIEPTRYDGSVKAVLTKRKEAPGTINVRVAEQDQALELQRNDIIYETDLVSLEYNAIPVHKNVVIEPRVSCVGVFFMLNRSF